MTCAAIAALVVLIAFTLYADAEAHHCRTSSCAKLKRSYTGCKKLHPGRAPARLFCEISRAARHYHQSAAAMRSVAYCESTYRWWISGAHQGAFQFLWSTWWTTPYRHRSPYHPRWASLATAWMWAHGRRGEWAC